MVWIVYLIPGFLIALGAIGYLGNIYILLSRKKGSISLFGFSLLMTLGLYLIWSIPDSSFPWWIVPLPLLLDTFIAILGWQYGKRMLKRESEKGDHIEDFTKDYNK